MRAILLLSAVALFRFGIGPAVGCPAPPAPAHVTQQASVAGGPESVVVQAVEAPQELPRLLILTASCRVLLATTFGEPGEYDDGSAFRFRSLLRFKVARIRGFPQPLIVAIGAAPAGDNTLFETQLIAAENGRYRLLLPKPVDALLEGGVHIGALGGGNGAGVAWWDVIWEAGEAHIDPKRYALHRLRWDGTRFVALPDRETRRKYADSRLALRELGVRYPDMTLTFHDFAAYR
jgi:hypothetical protein